MKALYLDGQQAMSVGLDGPALRVSGGERADGRYPLRRLSRVVVSGHVDWSTPALLACLERGVPVTFLDVRGHLIGYCFGSSRRKLPLVGRLQEFLDRPDWAEHYGNWFRAMEREAIRACLRRLRRPLNDLRPERVQYVLEQGHHTLAKPGQVRRLHAQLFGLLNGLVTELVRNAGLQPDLVAFARRDLNLVTDLSRLLDWELHTVTHRLLKRSVSGQSEIVAAFERESDRLQRRGAGYLGKLERRLKELLP